MLNSPVRSVIPKMALPTIVAFLINSIYSLADTYFVSSLGTNATAAVSVNQSVDLVIMMVGSLLAVGSNSLVARLLGAREEEKASKVISTAFFLAFGFGLVLLGVGTSLIHPLVRLLGATPTCEQYSVDYARYVLLVAPFMTCNFVMNQCLRAEGSATLSMIGMGFGGILNCFLDPIFIFYLDLGVAGASMATAISKLVSFSILIFPYLTRRSYLHLSIKNVKIRKEIIQPIASVGSSSMFRTGLSVLSGVILNNIAGGISDSVLAGIGVTNKIMMFPFGIILGFSNGFQPVAGFNWGAKRYDRVKESYRYSSRVALLGAALMGVAIGVFSDQIIGLFTEADTSMMEIGSLCIRLQCIALPIHAWVAIVNMYCAALGKAKGAFILATARQGSCFIPFVHLAAYLGGEYGIAAIQAVADFFSIFLAIPVSRNIRNFVDKTEKEAGKGLS